MNAHEGPAVAPLRRMDGEPVFDEPWQAQVLAMADSLIARGVVAPVVWSETLGDELRQAEARGELDDAATHYRAALRALERIVVEHGGISAEAISQKHEAWTDAYLSTPHGQPVVLKDR